MGVAESLVYFHPQRTVELVQHTGQLINSQEHVAFASTSRKTGTKAQHLTLLARRHIVGHKILRQHTGLELGIMPGQVLYAAGGQELALMFQGVSGVFGFPGTFGLFFWSVFVLVLGGSLSCHRVGTRQWCMLSFGVSGDKFFSTCPHAV